MAFTSDDYAAFMAYAGSPPLRVDRPNPLRVDRPNLARANALNARLEYIDKCNTFCNQYFEPCPTYEIRTKFYTEFMTWYRIRQHMQAKDVSLDLMTYEVRENPDGRESD